LKPQEEQRQTACIRYISAWHRSHSILSSLFGAVVLTGEIGRADRWGGAPLPSDIAGIIAYG
jgi:hypothetical protein